MLKAARGSDFISRKQSSQTAVRLIRMNLMTYLRSVNTSIIGVFFSSGAPYFGPTNTNHTKNTENLYIIDALA